MRVAAWLRGRVQQYLLRSGYKLQRVSVTGRGWDEVLKTAFADRAHDGTRAPTVLDIGAHRGTFSRRVLAMSPNAKVFAFEPIPALAAELAAIRSRHANFRVVPVAIGSACGTATLKVHSHVDSSSLLRGDPEYAKLYPCQMNVVQEIQVPVVSVDSWVVSLNGELNEIDLLKVDVQGYEREVLSGAANSLKHVR